MDFLNFNIKNNGGNANKSENTAGIYEDISAVKGDNVNGGNNNIISSFWGGNKGNADEYFNIQYADIVILHSQTNESIDKHTFFIDYVDATEFRCVDTDDLENRFVFKMKTDVNTGKTVLVDAAALSSVEIISRSNVLGYTRNNGLIVKEDQPITVLIEWNPLFQKPITQAKIVGLEEDCLELETIETVPEHLFIDFEYKGLPDYISKLRILSATIHGETPEEILNEEAGNWEETEAIAETDETLFQEGDDILRSIAGEDVVDAVNSENEEMEEMGEIDVQITKSNARFSLNIQKQDLMDKLYLQYPKHLQTPELDVSINIHIQRFVDLRQMFSSFENTPITVRKMDKQPIASYLLNDSDGGWGKNWFIPVVHLRKSVFYLGYDKDRASGFIENMDDAVINQYANSLYFQDLGSLEQERQTKWEEYTAGRLNGGDGNSFDYLMKSMLHKSWKMLETTADGLMRFKFKNNREVFINNQTQPSHLSFLPTIEANYPKFHKTEITYITTNNHPNNSAASFLSPLQLVKNDITHIRSFVIMPQPMLEYSRLWLPSTNLKHQTELALEPLQMFQWIGQPPVAYPIKPNTDTDLYSGNYVVAAEKNNKKKTTPPDFAFDMTHYYLDDDTQSTTTTQTNPAVLLQETLQHILPKTSYYLEQQKKLGNLQQKYSFLDVVKQMETMAIYPENIENTVCDKIVGKDGILENNLRHFKNQWRRRSGDLKGQWDILKNIYKSPAAYNDLHLLFSRGAEQTAATIFADTYQIALKNTTSGRENPRIHWTNSEIIYEACQIDQSRLFNLLFIQMVLEWLNPQQFLSGNVPIEVDLDVNVKETRKRNYRKKHLHKKYTNEDDLRRDNKDDVFVDEEFIDPITRELMDKYANAGANGGDNDDVLQEKMLATLVDKEGLLLTKLGIDTTTDEENNEAIQTLIQTILQGKCRIVDGDYAMLVETKKRMTVNRLGKKIQEIVPFRNRFYKRVKNIWIYDNSLTSEQFQNIQELTQQYNKICRKGEMDEENGNKKTKILYEFERRYSHISAEIKEQITTGIDQQIHFIHNKRKLERQWSLFQNETMQKYAQIYDTKEAEEPVVISQFTTLRNLIFEQPNEAKKYYDIVVFYDQYCRQAIVPQEYPYWAYCRQTNTPLLPIALLKLAKSFNTGITQNYINTMNEICANPELTTISDDGGFYVLKQGGYNIRPINDTTEENIAYQLLGGGTATQESEEITNQFIDQLFDNMTSTDISSRVVNIVYQYLNRQFGIVANRRVFDAMQIIFNDVKRNRKVVKDEAGYNDYILKKNAKETNNNASATGGIKDPPYAEHLQKVYVIICAASYFAIVQSIYPAVQVSKINRQSPVDCVFSLQGFPLHTDDEKNEGLHYLSCVLYNNKSDTIPWKSLRHQNKDAMFKLLKGVMNFVIQVPLLLNTLIDKRTKLSNTTTTNNQNYPAEDIETVQAWLHFLPPIVPFTVIKQINSVPETVQVLLNETIQQMKKGGIKQREMLLKVQSMNLLLTYGLVERVNRLVKAEQLLFASKSNMPYLENACCDKQKGSLTTSIQYFTEKDAGILEYIQQSQILDEHMTAFNYVKIAPFVFYTTPPIYPVHWITTSTEIQTVLRTYIHYLYDLKMWKDVKIQSAFPFLSRRDPPPPDYNREWSYEKKKDVLLGSSGNNHNVVEYIENLPLFMKLIHAKNRVIPFVSLTASELRHRKTDSFTMVLETLLEKNPQNIIYLHLQQYIRENPLKDEAEEKKAEEEAAEDIFTLDDLKDTLYSSKNRLIDNLAGYLKKGKERENQTNTIPFLFLEEGIIENIKKKTLDLQSQLQFIKNSLYYFLQYIPNKIIGFDKTPEKKCLKMWGFSDLHEEILTQYWEKEGEWLKSFNDNPQIKQFLLQYREDTADYVRLIQNLPKHLFSGALFDLYSYFFVNSVFMYIELSVKIEAESVMTSSTTTSTTNQNNSAVNIGEGVVGSSGVSRMNAIYLESVIRNEDEQTNITEQVVEIVRLGLKFVENNQTILYKSYDAIIADTRLNALEEKKMIMNRLENLSKKERAVEKLMKMYKLGSWNVGKEVFVYNKKVYDADVNPLNQSAVNIESGVDDGDGGDGDDGVGDEEFFENQANEAAENSGNSYNVNQMGDDEEYERGDEDDEVYDNVDDGGYDDDNDGNRYAGDEGEED